MKPLKNRKDSVKDRDSGLVECLVSTKESAIKKDVSMSLCPFCVSETNKQPIFYDKNNKFFCFKCGELKWDKKTEKIILVND